MTGHCSFSDFNLQFECKKPWLIATFARPHRMVSWSLNKPGFTTTKQVSWLEVHNEELIDVDEPISWFKNRLSERGLANSVGLMTARNIERYEHCSTIVDDIKSECLITLGLNNGETVGQRFDPTLQNYRLGTINLLVSVSAPLNDAALLEISSIATQARTKALIKFGYRRPGMTEIVTGTGTDCIVAAAPLSENPTCYAGMHTAIGEAVGSAVFNATMIAAEAWFKEWGDAFK